MNQHFPPLSVVPSELAPGAGEEDEAFTLIFNNSPYGKIIIGEDGIISAVNDLAVKLFGYEKAELIGTSIDQLLPERYRHDHASKRAQYGEDRSARVMGQGRDLTGLRKDGVEFPLEIGLTPFTTSEGPMTCAAIVDITERQRTERRLREVNAQLEEFTYVASHDLRSPIRGISNLIEFIREDFEDGQLDGVLKNIDRMEARVHSVEKLIDDLLTYARAGNRAVQLEPTSLSEILSDIIAIEDIPDGFAVKVEASDEPFDAARTPLTTVLRNLISNAIKHHDRDEGTVTVTARLQDNQALIDIADDGPGIPENARERVFRLFQTLKASERGSSGLGLAVAQRLATGHGGQLDLVPSITERGTTFRLTWPRFTRTDLNA
ncbi:sensory box histidine kinase [Erythrobacter sp. NAP1]|uniref:sensor histidine kinase n=1 Tax=Erythrobacter sp. NAP1 TaxID=237727 RepID=UPI0000686BF1|nr:PAS domain-containing sensor histidine kinase [Erythrobacter sp. NAP1]EAQ30532.1 sensory box histidine kinase [Erythrobacter sp. NAP1]